MHCFSSFPSNRDTSKQPPEPAYKSSEVCVGRAVGPLDEIQIYNRGLTPKKVFDLFTDKQLTGGFVSRWTSDDG